MDYRIDHIHLHQVQPIGQDYDQENREQKEKKERQVIYQGRAWVQKEKEDQFSAQELYPSFVDEDEKRKKKNLYVDPDIVSRAQYLLSQFDTLEEKVAQLLFYETEASYHPEWQQELEKYVAKWQISGILFTKGGFQRQSSLTEYYQKQSRLPLLIGNDFFHGLSFYDQKEQDMSTHMSPQRLLDLGKAVTIQNRQLGVHFQIDQRSYVDEEIGITGQQIRSFREGIRLARGMVGTIYEQKESKQLMDTYCVLPLLPLKLSHHTPSIHYSRLKTLHLCRLDLYSQSSLSEMFQRMCTHNVGDGILVSSDISDVILGIATLIREGQCSVEQLDKLVLKILMIKLLIKKF